jgi:hypothetical protein
MLRQKQTPGGTGRAIADAPMGTEHPQHYDTTPPLSLSSGRDQDFALAVARIVQGDRPDLAGLETWPSPWRNLAQVGAEAVEQGKDPAAAIEREIDRLDGNRQAIRSELYAAAGRLFAEDEAEASEVSDCPPLPEEAQIGSALDAGAGMWVTQYADHAETRAPMTPRLFHVGAALWLGAVAIARRLKIAMPFGDIYPNLFILWLAVTTLFRKSTALDIARDLARRAFPHLMAAQDTTPEALLSDMAGREPPFLEDLSEADRADWRMGRNFAAQKGWPIDEMSGLIAGAGKDYNAGLVEILLRFYDCDQYFRRSTRAQGLVVVRHSYLSVLGASTPAAMSRHLTAEGLWSMGWWPRFAILTPDTNRPPWREARGKAEPPELVGRLQQLNQQLPAPTWPNPPEARTVTLGKDVYDAWARFNKALSYDLLTDDLEQRLFGVYGRLPTQALKVALILSALDGWPDGHNAPVIELRHLARAIAICEDWRASAHRAVALARASASEKVHDRILLYLAQHAQPGPTLRDLCKAMQDVQRSEIEDALKQLIGQGLVLEVDWQNPNGGPRTTRYRLAR